MMRLILIRHGSTNYNLKKKYCGFTDIGLNKIGKLQARKLKTKLKRFKIDMVFTSDLKRSFQTARIIFGQSFKITKNKNLREINFGRWEGLDFKQITKVYASIYKRWLKNPFSINIPDGEKMIRFRNRIKNELKNIMNHNIHKTIAIVGHAGPIRVILNDCWGIRKNVFWKIEIEPQAVYVIEYKNTLKPKVYKI